MRQQQDFILLIMNCQKYRYKAIYQKKDWLINLPPNIIYYHVIGNINLEKQFFFYEDERILWVKTDDDYNSLPKKVIAAYEAINNSFSFKYILKTDDDQKLINIKLFDTIINILSVKTPQIHYGGNIVDVQFAYLSQYYKIHPELPKHLPVYQTKYCNGRFYFISNLAVLDLISKKYKIEQEFLEDYAVGYNLNELLKVNTLDIKTDKYFKDYLVSDYNSMM